MAFKGYISLDMETDMGGGGADLLIFNVKQVKTLYEGSLHEYSLCVCVCVRACMSECMLLNGTAKY